MNDCSVEANLVSNLKGVALLLEHNESLLLAARGDHGVDLAHFAVGTVELFAGSLDLRLGGSLGDDEHEGVVVFRDFHGGLRSAWVLDDSELVVGVFLLVGVVLDFVVDLGLLGLWSSEGGGEPLGCFLGGVGTLLHLAGSVLSLPTK